MPLTLASVLGFIPTQLWRQLKKFVTRDAVVVFDIPFKLSTKYTPALLIIMMCLSFANQFVRNIEIDCTYGGTSAATQGRGGSGYNTQGGGGGDTELNDYCWNHDTFLVEKALTAEMRPLVTYPGVSGYDRGKDAIIKQRYYKQVWFVVCKMAVLAFLPFFFWKLRGAEKMRSLIEVAETDENTEDEVRVTYFLETLGFNDGFALYYLFCKVLAATTPALAWVYLTGFMGHSYRFYGWDVTAHYMNSSDNWPNPMDRLFPKMAKCEWARYGFGGDIELKSAQCQLPMNNLSQWSFFLLWWWTVIVFVVNFISCIRLLFLWICRPYRRIQYRSFVQRACKQDVEKARTYTVHQLNGQFMTRRYRKSDIVMVDLTFGDWLVLSFLKRNIQDWQFKEFIKRLIVTENSALQLKPMPSLVVDDTRSTSSIDKASTGKADYPIPMSIDAVDGKGNPLTSTPAHPPPMGFINPYTHGHHPHVPSLPTYSACGSNDCDEDMSSPSTPQIVDGDDSSLGNTSVTMLMRNQTTVNITPPAKINRHQRLGLRPQAPQPLQVPQASQRPKQHQQLTQQLQQHHAAAASQRKQKRVDEYGNPY